MIRAPVMPKGWPSAIAPPCGFSLSMSMPHSSAIGRTWAANASFSSTTSTSSMVIPARSSTFLIAPIGATPMISGSSPLVAEATIRARGLTPSSRARSSDMTSVAAAPSLSGHEFPAVTRPFSRNAGFSCESFSTELSARGPSSLSTVLPSGSSTATISRSKKPESRAVTARSCERWAYSSMSSRATSYFSATFSAVSPMAM